MYTCSNDLDGAADVPILHKIHFPGITPPMLEMRPNCELCDCELPPDSAEARICSYECTFCAACADTVLMGVCPNCGGDLGRARSVRKRRGGRHSRWTEAEREVLTDRLRGVPPSGR
jgi:hypothetical protein